MVYLLTCWGMVTHLSSTCYEDNERAYFSILSPSTWQEHRKFSS